MNKRELARVLIRMLGVSMVASGVPSFVSSVVIALWTFGETFGAGKSSSSIVATTPARLIVVYVLQLAIGLYLFYRGGWIVRSLLRVDETSDL
ncbi:MAG: hypothetical protein ABSH21_01190 [Verrucomicrobiia bacterium]|jgi:dipeptide/tripeptide permease